MITEAEAIQRAKEHVAGWDFVDPNAVETPVWSDAASALAAGVKDGPWVRAAGGGRGARLTTGHPMDEVFDSLTVRVDAETGATSVLASL